MRKKITLAVLTAILIGTSAHAQRTDYKTSFIGLNIGTTYSHLAASIDYGYYLTTGYIEAGLSLNNTTLQSQITGNRYLYTPLMVNAGYMYRVFSGDSRVVNVYAGGGVALGMETYDLFKQLPNNEKPVRGSKFLYGVYPKAAVEWFFWRNLALVGTISLPFNINSSLRWWGVNTFAGVKVNF